MADKDVTFLQEVARFFDKQAADTHEDMTFWAMTNNAWRCREIAARIEAFPAFTPREIEEAVRLGEGA